MGNIDKGYGYHVSVIDRRDPTRSNGNNILHLVNKSWTYSLESCHG